MSGIPSLPTSLNGRDTKHARSLGGLLTDCYFLGLALAASALLVSSNLRPCRTLDKVLDVAGEDKAGERKIRRQDEKSLGSISHVFMQVYLARCSRC